MGYNSFLLGDDIKKKPSVPPFPTLAARYYNKSLRHGNPRYYLNKEDAELPKKSVVLPAEMMQNDIIVPNTPKDNMVAKFLKNCFFLT